MDDLLVKLTSQLVETLSIERDSAFLKKEIARYEDYCEWSSVILYHPKKNILDTEKYAGDLLTRLGSGWIFIGRLY